MKSNSKSIIFRLRQRQLSTLIITCSLVDWKAFYSTHFTFQEYREDGPSWTMFRNLGDNITEIVASNKFYEKGIVPCPPLDGWHVSHPVRFYKSNNFFCL